MTDSLPALPATAPPKPAFRRLATIAAPPGIGLRPSVVASTPRFRRAAGVSASRRG
jgi:hypothetical protein